MSRYQEFMAAKQVIRLHPEYTDEQVAEEVGINPDRDKPGMNIIRQARMDLAAGDTTQPDTRPA